MTRRGRRDRRSRVALELLISRRTTEHHIYVTIGASTRAADALFAMEHGLLR